MWESSVHLGVSHALFQGGGDQGPPNFWDPCLGRNGLTYSDEIWYGNTRGGLACFWGQPRPHPKGRPQRPQIFWDPLYMRPNGWTYSDEIRHGNTVEE